MLQLTDLSHISILLKYFQNKVSRAMLSNHFFAVPPFDTIKRNSPPHWNKLTLWMNEWISYHWIHNIYTFVNCIIFRKFSSKYKTLVFPPIFLSSNQIMNAETLSKITIYFAKTQNQKEMHHRMVIQHKRKKLSQNQPLMRVASSSLTSNKASTRIATGSERRIRDTAPPSRIEMNERCYLISVYSPLKRTSQGGSSIFYERNSEMYIK